MMTSCRCRKSALFFYFCHPTSSELMEKKTWQAHHNLILFALNSNKISWSSRKLKLVRTADQLQPNPNWVTVLMPLVPTAPDLATRYDLVTPKPSCWPSQRGGKATWNPSAVIWTNSNKTAARQLDQTGSVAPVKARGDPKKEADLLCLTKIVNLFAKNKSLCKTIRKVSPLMNKTFLQNKSANTLPGSDKGFLM